MFIKFEDFLSENVNNFEVIEFSRRNVIVCGFEPALTFYMDNFPIQECMETIVQHKGNTLYLYEGYEDEFSHNSILEIKDWYVEKINNKEMYDKKISWVYKSNFLLKSIIDDYGIENTKLIASYMIKNDKYSDEDIKDEDLTNLNLPLELTKDIKRGLKTFKIPKDLIKSLKTFDNCVLIGCKESLNDLIIILDVLGIKYILGKRFVF